MAEAKAKKFKITFHSDENDKGDVMIGHNFQLNVFKRDVEAIIDEHFLEVVENSVINTTMKNEKGEVALVTIPRYNYTVKPA